MGRPVTRLPSVVRLPVARLTTAHTGRGTSRVGVRSSERDVRGDEGVGKEFTRGVETPGAGEVDNLDETRDRRDLRHR